MNEENKEKMLMMKPAAKQISFRALARRRQSSSASAQSPLDASSLTRLATREGLLSSSIPEKEIMILLD